MLNVAQRLLCKAVLPILIWQTQLVPVTCQANLDLKRRNPSQPSSTLIGVITPFLGFQGRVEKIQGDTAVAGTMILRELHLSRCKSISRNRPVSKMLVREVCEAQNPKVRFDIDE